MIKLKEPANLLDLLECPYFEGRRIAAHSSNCHHVMGGGIAKQIAERFPQAYAADKNTPKGGIKLGTFSTAPISLEPGKERQLYNIYGQDHPGKNGSHSDSRATSYDALYDGMGRALVDCALRWEIKGPPHRIEVLLPYGMGCGLGCGSWTIVEALIKDLDSWANKTWGTVFSFVICKL